MLCPWVSSPRRGSPARSSYLGPPLNEGWTSSQEPPWCLLPRLTGEISHNLSWKGGRLCRSNFGCSSRAINKHFFLNVLESNASLPAPRSTSGHIEAGGPQGWVEIVLLSKAAPEESICALSVFFLQEDGHLRGWPPLLREVTLFSQVQRTEPHQGTVMRAGPCPHCSWV